MLDHKLTRRTLLKSAAATGALLGLGTSGKDFKLKSLFPSKIKASGAEKYFYNACPRNCYDTCSIVTTVKDGRITFITGNDNNTYTKGRLCVKGNTYPRVVYSPDRIKYPMRQKGKGSGNWERISWDEAYTIIANKILEIKKEYGNTLPICLNKYSGNFNILNYSVEGMFSSIGYTTRAKGTPCEPAGADAQAFDMGVNMANDPEQFLQSKYIILWGSNPAWTSVHSMYFIEQAKEKGTKLVVIDPIVTATASKADEYIQINPSTDGALALGMAKYIVDHHLYNEEWLAANAKGFHEFFNYLQNNITLDWAAKKTGVPVPVIERLAREYATAKPANIWIGFGMQRHTNGGSMVRAIDALAALTGNIGVTGGGVNYIQAETWTFNYHVMSFPPPKGSKGEKDRYVNMNNFGAQVLATQDPPIKMMWIACRNPVSQDPEPNVVKKALHQMDLVVTADLFMNQTVEMSDIVLPVTTPFETVGINASYWHYWLNMNEQAIKPLHEAKSDLEIAMGLSKKLNELAPGSCTFPSSGNLEDWVEKEVNDDLRNLYGIRSWRDLKKKGTVKARKNLTPWKDEKFRTPSGKYEFWSDQAMEYGHHPLPVFVEEMKAPKEFPIRCISPHWKFGIHSQFQNIDWLMNIQNEPFIEIHPDLARKKGIQEGDYVKMYNDIGAMTLPAKVTKTVPVHTVVIYEAWFKGVDYNQNFTVKAIPSDMGDFQKGQRGIAFHDNFVNIQKVLGRG
ncbi:molybdopterin-dependent oxidoreductase [Bacillus sp. DTU_2020_1000418_1_SI_GHA_SEK_038]|uniref:molybdopterin-dependent oxidoreductase n=1 Tax=Bacillus sp. DTU_2020_1000418_1_SI_GHA_SEK_038 TaxID=3077585 RepID=UPI0028E40B66|nr:molybdopterin-dependent oxidoreductase [Bacillus sp. DTU_2020_1000418_1_SI_GHA_SEK_038]WNS74067.1 molybdopterin-dependent oxidoreductase [Bacillus sp. DTU_2020_1000418_1_SI_GHA_SEK_038]